MTVRGSDSRLETKSFLNVLTGSLRVLNGGTVRCRVATIGDARDDRKSHAAVVLEGNGSRCEARASIIVGSDGAHGTARLTVRDGAEMHSRKSVHIRPSGIVQLGGGSLRSALIDITHGSLAGFGHVLADVRNGGMVELSPDDGVLAIDGSFEQIASGRLRITTVRPPFGNSIAFLNCDGDVRLNGCLELRCADAPQLGDAIKLLCAKSITGEFSELDLPPLPDSEAWRLQVRNGCMTLTVVAR